MNAKKTAAPKPTEGVPARRDSGRAGPPTCNAPDCTKAPTVRGLCDPHYATLRGLANPKG